jgi:uncharacterized protein YidB (DUF937 family)
MGLLDEMLGSLTNSATAGGGVPAGQSSLAAVLNSLGSGNQTQSTGLLTIAMSLLQQHGGLSSVLGMFRQNGMGQHADSWVGNGPNMPVSGEQVQQVFGHSSIADVASQLGQSHGQASATMAQILPALVNHLTPQGQVPSNIEDVIANALGTLRGGGQA